MATKLQREIKSILQTAVHMRPFEEVHLGSNVYARYVIEKEKALSIKQPWAWLIANGWKDTAGS